MGIYLPNIEKYREKITVSDEQMEETKKNILADYQKTYQAVSSDLNRAMHLHLSSSTVSHQVDLNNKLETVKALINDTKNLNVPEFYDYLRRSDLETLNKLMENANISKESLIKKINAYKNQEGLTAKLSSAFGTDKRKIEKNQNLLAEEERTISVAQDSINELQGLSAEDQLIYFIGRFEIDNKSQFDSEKFIECKNRLKELNQENELGNSSEKQ